MTGETAYAKLNLTLDVLGRRPDGYHEMCMVMESVSLADQLEFSREGSGVRAESNLAFLDSEKKNLAVLAALKFQECTGCKVEPLVIRLEKRIPVCAGMGGGSSDAAAVLRYLNRTFQTGLSSEELGRLGESIGADVPYCVAGGTVLAEGKGERLTPLPRLLQCIFVLCKPSFGVSTPMLFKELDRRRTRCHPDTQGLLDALGAKDLQGAARRMYNVFEDVLPVRWGMRVAEIKGVLTDSGALGAAMSGTGPTVFGVFDDPLLAQNAYQRLREEYSDTFLTHNV